MYRGSVAHPKTHELLRPVFEGNRGSYPGALMESARVPPFEAIWQGSHSVDKCPTFCTVATLRQHALDGLCRHHARESLVEPTVVIRQVLMIQPHQVQDGCV